MRNASDPATAPTTISDAPSQVAPQTSPAHDGPVDQQAPGTPVGRRVVLGLLGLAGVGVAMGSRASEALNTVAAKDPTGLSNLIPGGGRFRYYSVVSSVEEVTRDRYSLMVDGLVERPGMLSMAQLNDLPQTTLMHDVQCVTGWRVPQVAWEGVLLRDVLESVGVGAGAGAVTFGSFDGVYTESLTLEQALRDDILVATAMQAAPITHDHGGPVRLYVAPMYFYKSCKWLDRITVTEQVQPGYWEVRGYDIDAWVGGSNGRDDTATV